MDEKRYNQLRSIIVLVIGLMVAFGAVRHNWVLMMVTALFGIVLLSTIRKQVTEVLHDERTKVIHQKAASRTIGYFTALTGIFGLALVELSYRGFPDYRSIGYAFAYQATIIMGVNALFIWYYQRQMGG